MRPPNQVLDPREPWRANHVVPLPRTQERRSQKLLAPLMLDQGPARVPRPQRDMVTIIQHGRVQVDPFQVHLVQLTLAAPVVVLRLQEWSTVHAAAVVATYQQTGWMLQPDSRTGLQHPAPLLPDRVPMAVPQVNDMIPWPAACPQERTMLQLRLIGRADHPRPGPIKRLLAPREQPTEEEEVPTQRPGCAKDLFR